MKKLLPLTILIAMSLNFTSCSSYTTVTKVAKGKVAVVKNDGFLWGITRGPQVWICSATSRGLKNCRTNENP